MVKGLTCGAFDLCHAGHMQMFKEAKTKCQFLIVGLQDDPSITDAAYRGKKKARPIMPLIERLEILKGVRYVDEVFVYTTEEDLYIKLQAHDHDLRIVGADWEGKKFTGWDLGKEVYYNSRSHSLSTTELKRRIVERYIEMADKMRWPSVTTDYMNGWDALKEKIRSLL